MVAFDNVSSKLRITYNAPVVLTFAVAAVIVQLLPDSMKLWFAAWPDFHGIRSYVGLISHPLGHANWDHLLGNFAMILLIGPILEERHGSFSLLMMCLITALVTGLFNVMFMNTFLIGASGIVFMMIVLASMANIRQREIPLTFIAVAFLYLGREAVDHPGHHRAAAEILQPLVDAPHAATEPAGQHHARDTPIRADHRSKRSPPVNSR